MTDKKVNSGGITASGKSAKASGPKLAVNGNPDNMRKVLKDGREVDGIVFIAGAGCGHLWLDPPRPKYDEHGREIGMHPGLFVDFQGVGRTKPYNPNLETDFEQIQGIRACIARTPRHPDVVQFNIQELEPEAPVRPFERWDELNADAIEGWIKPQLSADHDQNVRIVQQCAAWEAYSKDRDDVLGMLDGLLAQEASKSDAFATEIKLA